MPLITVKEASETYVGDMRNPEAPGPGVCARCRTFIDLGWEHCSRCHMDPDYLDAVVPITYSVHFGPVHHALRYYKDGQTAQTRRYLSVRVAGVLYRFLQNHEKCVAEAAGVSGFDVVTTVPSGNSTRDAHNKLREIVTWIHPVEDRLRQVIQPTDQVEHDRRFSAERFRAVEKLSGEAVLLIDDTWTTGASAQSAAYALREAGASGVALVTIGRHLNPSWIAHGEESGEIVKKLPPFAWDRCCVD